MAPQTADTPLWQYAKREWGGIATPKAISGIPLGSPGITIYVHRPDNTTPDVAAANRYLSWRHGFVRPTVDLVLVIAVAFGYSRFIASPVLLIIAVVNVLVIDTVIGEVLRRKSLAALKTTRSAHFAVTPGKRHWLKPDTPPTLASPAGAMAVDLFETVQGLHSESLVDGPEWDEARWALWDTLGMSQQTRAAVGWPNLADRLSTLIETARRRSA